MSFNWKLILFFCSKLETSFFFMERFGIQNPVLVSFLLIISSNYFASSQNDAGFKHEWAPFRVQVRVGLVLDLGSVEGKILGSSVSMALSNFYAVNSDYKTRVSLSVRNSRGELLLALASGNSDYIILFSLSNIH